MDSLQQPSSRCSSAFKFITCLSKCARMRVWMCVCVANISADLLHILLYTVYVCYSCDSSCVGIYMYEHTESMVYGWGSANRWEVVGCAFVMHTHAHTHKRQRVSACKLVSLLWADRVDKPFMRGINKVSLPLSQLSVHSFNLKLQISF